MVHPIIGRYTSVGLLSYYLFLHNIQHSVAWVAEGGNNVAYSLDKH